jgi:predicted TIM-barrel fold metal-dependent hydrolase
MRSLGHSKQIISHVPLVAAPQICSKINDAMHAAVNMNGERFAALGLLPAGGKEAARELVRCVAKMKFVGGCIGMSRQNRLEGEEWDELWDTAERYRVPVLLREMWPVGSEVCRLCMFQGAGEGERRRKHGLKD